MKFETRLMLIVIFLFAFFACSLWYMVKSDFMDLKGRSFCEAKGYDSVSIFGQYSEKFGKVSCVSCYNRECTYEEFNVTKKFGIIKEAQK